MPTSPTSAPPQHRLGRLAVAGIVLIAATAAFALNHNSRGPDIHDWTGVQMNGTTS